LLSTCVCHMIRRFSLSGTYRRFICWQRAQAFAGK
jgi:hypothetical protein